MEQEDGNYEDLDWEELKYDKEVSELVLKWIDQPVQYLDNELDFFFNHQKDYGLKGQIAEKSFWDFNELFKSVQKVLDY